MDVSPTFRDPGLPGNVTNNPPEHEEDRRAETANRPPGLRRAKDSISAGENDVVNAVEVSVVMPVYNGESFLAASIDSILAQSFKSYEIIVIDDGSKDASAEIIEAYDEPRIRLVRNGKNEGIVYSLNRALALAKGDLIARQDADDISHPERLDHQVRYLKQHPGVALVGSQARLIDESGEYCGFVERSREQAGIRWGMMFGNEFTHTSVMFRRSIIRDELGGYRPFLCCEDYDLWSRVAAEHAVANLAVPLVDSRVNTSSITQSQAVTRGAEVAIWRRKIVKRNLKAALDAQVCDREVDLIGRFSFEVPKSSMDDYVSVIERLLPLYKKAFPTVSASRDLRRTVARQFKRLFMTSLRVSPSTALRIFTKCALVYPLPTLSLVLRRWTARRSVTTAAAG